MVRCFLFILSIALPLHMQIFRQAQAAEPIPPQTLPAPEAVPPVQPPQLPAQPPVAPGPQGPIPAQPGGVPGRPERTLLPPPSVTSGGMVSLNFNRADLVEIIHILAQHLRLTYTIDPEVKGTVTINSAEPLRTEDLLPIFHQVLRMNGAVAVRAGNIYRIMPIKDGKGLARPMGAGREDSYALQIVPVRFFAVAEMKKVLTPFVMPGGEIIENPSREFPCHHGFAFEYSAVGGDRRPYRCPGFCRYAHGDLSAQGGERGRTCHRDDKSHAGLRFICTPSGEFYRAVPRSATNQPAPGDQSQ